MSERLVAAAWAAITTRLTRRPCQCDSPTRVELTAASRRFAPLFVTQFLGAFNDNLLKSALAIVVTYRLADADRHRRRLRW